MTMIHPLIVVCLAAQHAISDCFSYRRIASKTGGIRESCREGFVAGIRLGAFGPALEDGIEHALSPVGKVILQTGVDMIDVGRGFLVNYIFGKDALEGR